MYVSTKSFILLASAAIVLIASSASAQDRHAYFGQTHQHTSWSLDAYILGNTATGPEEAYQYSLGQTIKHPAGYNIQIKTPLDFQGVTDHAEYVGVIRLANDPNSPISKLPIAQKLRVSKDNTVTQIFQWMAGSIASGKPIKELLDPSIINSVWAQNIAIAEKYNKPGEFTTFCSYEWTAMPQNQNMHRNVFFEGCKNLPTAPFTAIDSDHPEDLWNWMDTQRKNGTELLAISHNANLSNGLMFPIELDSKGRPIDAAWAQERLKNEPLTEIKQVKGASETNPALSPNDEFANFEIMNYLIGLDNSFSKMHGSYIREAYQNGLAMQSARGYNPYKMGILGASDSHNTASSYSQSNYFGDHGFADATPEARLAGNILSGMDILKTGTSGLGGVWAEENTRESIFAAMQRREVFATSGVRLTLRMFGGWGYDNDLLSETGWVQKAYAGGVPMGGDLSQADGKAPSFIVWALKDPVDGNLDRIQIIKGWTKDGQIFDKIYDVVWSGDRKPDPVTGRLPSIGNTVDIAKATYTNDIGSVELKTLWTDPDFDPSQNAFYYARVIQIPTPRWSTYDAVKLGILPPGNAPATVQERAWGTPIWYTPTEAEEAKSKSGLMVADLVKSQATALGDDELKKLVFGKNLMIRNTVTGHTSNVLFGLDGKRTVTTLDSESSQGGDPHSVSGSSAPYEIKDGHIVTTIDGTPFELTVYRSGDKYIAARNNEFGHANYELAFAAK
ncbi:DUF3604 domain-containing protein [Pusillimonas sp. ANT_WB101]|uniref:DUF3604 domain-containing protein n=1 Tax=Pusillimonas sp. ANT_WB101 TaxID=2597356 RepID=UPI0011EBBEC2|nr:DUF3604 domain-containing protein [Pusillimonas sp. ANT_WB101]KAA0910803.1 DUF3604 domain-containing protein [Pusillimonas sp. ANT_WB101]